MQIVGNSDDSVALTAISSTRNVSNRARSAVHCFSSALALFLSLSLLISPWLSMQCKCQKLSRLPSWDLRSCHTFVLLLSLHWTTTTSAQDVNVNARIQTCVNTRSLMRRQANTLTHSRTHTKTRAQATAHNLWPARFNLTTFDIDDDIH